MAILAINGGIKIRKKKFPAYKFSGNRERQAVLRVLKSGVLSGFLGSWHENFYGGKEVRSLEKEWGVYFGVEHAIALNSATSALYCAVGAIGTEPGDEIIVTPFSMSSSAIAPIIYGAIPVFADIEKDYFCLSAKSVEKKITRNTRAIIIVDLFGLPYDADAINKIAKKNKLLVIEDCAQAIGATYKGKYAGTLADVGIFSLNVHKHIHTGEGGIIVTNNDVIAERARMIRNHAEAVVDKRKQFETLVNMVGFNYRMTEITAAIARVQLKKLKFLLKKRRENVEYLTKKLKRIPCISTPKIRRDSTHAYYLQALKYNKEITNIPRETFVRTVKAELSTYNLREKEGVRIDSGYTKPLYLQPIFQKKTAFGSSGWPWSSSKSKVKYNKGICPVVENLFENTLITHELFRPPMNKKDLDDVAAAFEKVWKYRSELK